MKLFISSAITISLLSKATATSVTASNNYLADCFRRCENRYGVSGSLVNNCRSNCRSDMTYSGRDYRNSRNSRPTGTRSSRKRPTSSRSSGYNSHFVDDYFYDDDDYIFDDDDNYIDDFWYYFDDAVQTKSKGAVSKALKHLAVAKEVSLLCISSDITTCNLYIKASRNVSLIFF